MKVNKKIKQELLENFKGWRKELIGMINEYIKEMKGAETVEELMRIKRNMLIGLVYNLPLRSEHCYFCISNERELGNGCSACEYGKIHGICWHIGSDYDRINQAQKKLSDTIKLYYYKDDEKYEE